LEVRKSKRNWLTAERFPVLRIKNLFFQSEDLFFVLG